MRKSIHLFCLCIFAGICVNAQDFSNKGKDFWVAYGYHQVMLGNNQQQMRLYFATDQVTTITITIPGSTYTETLVSGPLPTVLTSAIIPKGPAQDFRLTGESTAGENKGIHVVSDKPIVAYAHIYNSSVSGASILFPTNTLGKEYYSVNFENLSNTTDANCWMYVIATDPGQTSVEITPSVQTINHPAGVPFIVTLNQGQVYNVMATFTNFGSPLRGGDLTGSKIKSISSGTEGCKRIAVFSGSGRITISCDGSTPSSDNYMVQAFPKTAWGKKYLTASAAGNQSNNIYRICVSDPSAVVTLNGAPITLPLIDFFYYQIPATSIPQRIESDQPILVSQYFTSQGACGNGNPGDPEVIYLSPVEQSISKVLWNATPNFSIQAHYFNVIIPNGGTALSSFKLDGVNVSPSLFTVHPQDPNYSYLKQNVLSGSRRIESDSGFNAIAYGFGQAESYGYNAGTNVKDLYQKIGVSSLYGIEAIPSVCTGSPFKFKISLPYQPDSMYWDFHNPAIVPAISNVMINSPAPLVFDSVTVINTKTVWWYSLPTYYMFNAVSVYPITITTYRQSTEGCGNTQEIDFDLEVSAPPVANFNFTPNLCYGQTVQFTDASTTIKPTYNWWWNFGDPGSNAANTSALKNPSHTFSAPGTYIVRYANITTPGCLSDTITKTVIINPLPTAVIAGSATVCLNSPSPLVTFTAANGTAPFTFTYTFNSGPQQTIVTNTGNSVSIPVPTTATGTFTYTLLSVVDGSTTLCSQAQSGSAVVVVDPLPSANIAGSGTVCLNAAPQVVTFTGANGTPQYTFTYNINNGPNLNVTTVTGNSVSILAPTNVAGTFTYNVTNVAGGSSSACSLIQNGSATVVVNPLPMALITGTTEVCLNAASPVINLTGSGNTGPYQFTYKINNGPSQVITSTGNIATISVPTNIAGTFTYSLVSVKDGSAQQCTQLQTGNATVTVNPLPVAAFTFSSPQCESKNIIFTDASSPNAGTINEWAWNFGDPASGLLNTSVLQAPTHIYNTPGNYTTTLSVKTDKGCASITPFTNTVTVNYKPNAGFIQPQVCLTDTWAQFSDTSSVAIGTVSAWDWNFGDIASGPLNVSSTQNPQHSYNSVGPKVVTLIATSAAGCKDTVVQTFIVNGDIPLANYTVNNLTTLCANDSVYIVNNSTVNVGSIIKLEIYWDNIGAPTVFESDVDPVAGKIYVHKYPASLITRNYTIRVRAYSGATCINDRIQTITVNASPRVQFDPIPDACLNVPPFQITQAIELGAIAGPPPVYSGPGISASGIFDPALVGPGLYTIKYVFTSNFGCSDTASQLIRVLAAPVASFSIGSPACEEQGLTFNDASLPTVGTLASWTWDFGDGSPIVIRTDGTPFTHTFLDPGNYTVKLFVTTSDGCNSLPKLLPVTVEPKPLPDFTFPAIACLPAAVIPFTNASSTGTYTWNFGDPISGLANTTTAFNPNHTFSTVGPYDVSLEVRSTAGCIQDTIIKVNTIHPQPISGFTTNKPGVCFGEIVNFTDQSNPADGSIQSWHWDFGDGNNSILQNPSHNYLTANDFTVSHYIINNLGCNSDTIKKVYPVDAYPVVNAGPDIFILEYGTAVMQPIVSGNELTYLWTPDIYFSDNTIKNAMASPDRDIYYTLIVTARGGCSDSDKVFVKVLLGPKIPNTFTPNNDNVNDKWIIKYLDTYPNNRVQIFTKTGQLVFESRGYKKPWDGTLNGKPLPIDTYYYIIEPGNGRKPMTGYITILK